MELNAGGHCAVNLIDPLTKKYTGETVDDLITYSEKHNGNHIIYDAIGRAISIKMNATTGDCPDVYAVATRGHLYPLKSGIVLRKKTIKYGERELDIPFKYGTTLPETLEFMSQVKPLMYNEQPTLRVDGASVPFGIDMNECYYAVSQIESNIGIPTISDYPKKYRGEKIKDHNYYAINTEFNILKRFGFTTNVISGRNVKLLKELISIKITRVLEFSKIEIFKSEDVKKAFEFKTPEEREEFVFVLLNDVNIEKEWRKEWRVFIGKCGRTTSDTYIDISDLPEEEIESLDDDLDEIRGKIITDTYDGKKSVIYKRLDTKHLNRAYIRTHIVEMANFAVLKKILANKKCYGMMPLKIKTDGLAYEKEIEIPDGWKFEKYRTNKNNYSFTEYKYEPKIYENETKTGKAGTGKTYRCERMDFDISSAFTNRKAKSINGITLARLLDHFKHGSLAHLENKIVWIDECFMVPNDYWGAMTDAYVNWGTRFIFSGDENQLGAVGEKKMTSNPFLGTIETLKGEHRCDEELQKIRDNVGAFKPTFETNQDYPDLNLAWRNSTRIGINNVIAEMKGVEMGDVGSEVLCRKTERKYYITNGELLKIKSNDGKYVEFEESDVKVPLKFLLGGGKEPNFALGYCLTVHCSQGETYDSEVGIHDWYKMDNELKLTAMTS